MAGGRPTKYKKKYCKMMIDYFNKQDFEVVLVKDGNKQEKEIEIPAKFPTFEGFAIEINVHRETLLNWCKEFPEFFDTYKRCQGYQKRILIENGLRGNYNCLFAKFVAINATDMREKTEMDITSKGEQINNLSEEELNKKIEEKLKLLNGSNTRKD
jgi:hypothetical protein